MVEFIASLAAPGAEATLRQAHAAAMGGASWIELRLDAWSMQELAETDPAKVLSRIRLPVLVACRLPRDGGAWQGELAQRRGLLQSWMDGGARGIDLEDWEEWTPDNVDKLQLYIRSHHNLSGVTAGLPALRDRLLRMGAHQAKLCVFAPDLADAAPVMQLLERTDQVEQPTVAFGLGQSAWPSRILACLMGAPSIYVAVESGQETAAGQVPLEWVAGGIYDLRRVGASTMLYGLLGNPAHHSLGPFVHNRAFRRLGHDGVYLPLETSRPETVLSMLPRRRLRGLSVTAPFKERMQRLCHVVDQDAELLGAINTMTFPAHGTIDGHNTDVEALELSLQAALPGEGGTGPRRGVVLGGGGAARAAALALRRNGFEVTILARSLERMRAFAKANDYRLARWDAGLLDELAPKAVVQATPVGGSAEGESSERVLPEWRIPQGTLVLDCVYRPRMTRLLQDVTDAGGIPVQGMEMFLRQAAGQLRLFTGEELSLEVLQQLLPAT